MFAERNMRQDDQSSCRSTALASTPKQLSIFVLKHHTVEVLYNKLYNKEEMGELKKSDNSLLSNIHPGRAPNLTNVNRKLHPCLAL